MVSKSKNVRNMNEKLEVKTDCKNNSSTLGGFISILNIVKRSNIKNIINEKLDILKKKIKYNESDFILSMAYNFLSGGKTINELDILKEDQAFLSLTNMKDIPDPTTFSDFCRRFNENDIDNLMDLINEARINIWKNNLNEEIARIDADGSFVPTKAETAEGIEYSGHKRDWGYHPCVISLGNTNEALYILNRGGARPSHEGAAAYLDKAADLCMRSGCFKKIMFRGDTDFSQTAYLDAWDDKGYSFVFGYDAMKNLNKKADEISADKWIKLEREKTSENKEKKQTYKRSKIIEKGYKNKELIQEFYSEFEYKPNKCNNTYRMVVLKKIIKISEGIEELFPEVIYFYYITNIKDKDAIEIIKEANQRCNQENLNAQLKSYKCLHAPLKDLNSNWAYMVIASLSWNIKIWVGILANFYSEKGQKNVSMFKKRIISMEFRTFVNNIIKSPCIVYESCKKTVVKILRRSRWDEFLIKKGAVSL